MNELTNRKLYQACILLTLFSSISLFGEELINGTLAHDNVRIFSIFRDNLYALNYFGEVAWWNPNMSKNGFPMYYFTILSDSFNSPIFSILCFFVWILGALKIYITNYHVLFVLYYGFVINSIFLISILVFAKQIIKNNLALLYVYTVACFSPAVLFSLTDRGLEHSAYSFLFLAAWIRFLRKRNRETFFLLAILLLILALSFSHLSLYWNVIFIPLFIIITIAINNDVNLFKTLYRSVPRFHWILLLFATIVCALPTVTTVLQGSGIYRLSSIVDDQGANILGSTLGGRIYPYNSLVSGNPFEFLSISTPGIGYKWGDVPLSSPYSLVSVDGEYVLYNYMGFLALPFVILALLFSPKIWKIRFLIILLFSVSVVLISADSPIFSLILAWPLPFRAVRHYSDVAFKIGVSNIILILAGLGFQTFIKFSNIFIVRIIFVIIMLASIMLSYLIFSDLIRSSFYNSVFYAEYAVLALFAILIISNLLVRSRNKSLLLFILTIVVLIDVSTQAFLFVKKNNKSSELPVIATAKFEYDDSPTGVLANDILGMDNSLIVPYRPYIQLVKFKEKDNRYFNLSENFNSKNWGNENGEWQSNSGFYTASHPDSKKSYTSVLHSNLADFTLDFNASLAGGGVYMRSKFLNGDINGILLAANKDQIHWHVVKNGEFGPQLNVVKIRNLDQKKHWKIIVQDGLYSIHMDNSKRPISILESNEFTSGDVALFSATSEFKFYDLNIDNNSLESASGTYKVINHSFNSMTINVTANEPSTLLWGDVNSQYWRAFRDNVHVPIIGMKNNAAKGVEVPAGSSAIRFVFSPGFLPWEYCMAYMVIFYWCYLLIAEVFIKKESFNYD